MENGLPALLIAADPDAVHGVHGARRLHGHRRDRPAAAAVRSRDTAQQNRSRAHGHEQRDRRIGRKHHDHGAERRPDPRRDVRARWTWSSSTSARRRAVRQVDPVHVGCARRDTWTPARSPTTCSSRGILNAGREHGGADPREPGRRARHDEHGSHRHGEGRHSPDVFRRTA